MNGPQERKHVLIAGGGIAGLEAVLALSKLSPELTDVELLSSGAEFVYRPLLVAEPFGARDALRLDLGEVAEEAGSRYTRGSVVSIQPDAKTVGTAEGKALPYDFLLIAIGAGPVDAVPGGLTFGTDEERESFGEVLAAFGRRGHKRIAFVVPPGVSWSIAAYELALLTAAERDARRLHATEILLVTHERAPLEVFGASAAELVASRLSDAGVSLRTGADADRVVDGRLQLKSGEELDPGAVVALPAPSGAHDRRAAAAERWLRADGRQHARRRARARVGGRRRDLVSGQAGRAGSTTGGHGSARDRRFIRRPRCLGGV